MAAILPPFPRFIFTILEPFSLIVAPIVCALDQQKFVASQLPSTSMNIKLYDVTPTDQILVLQLANMFGVIGFIGIMVLYTTSESKVVYRYLFACALGDLGHLAAVIYVMGLEDAINVRAWNDLAWGNIGFTVLIFGIRVGYLAGFLGKDRSDHGAQKPQKLR